MPPNCIVNLHSFVFKELMTESSHRISMRRDHSCKEREKGLSFRRSLGSISISTPFSVFGIICNSFHQEMKIVISSLPLVFPPFVFHGYCIVENYFSVFNYIVYFFYVFSLLIICLLDLCIE